jgi:hypothetical protein
VVVPESKCYFKFGSLLAITTHTTVLASTKGWILTYQLLEERRQPQLSVIVLSSETVNLNRVRLEVEVEKKGDSGKETGTYLLQNELGVFYQVIFTERQGVTFPRVIIVLCVVVSGSDLFKVLLANEPNGSR